MTQRVLTFVTGNANKLREVRQLLETSPASHWTLESKSLDVPEVQGTTQDVALAKCRSAAQQLQGPCLTEDTSLCYHALDGLPGPYIKDFLLKIGHDGLNRILAGFDNKGATALCTFAFCEGPGHDPLLFEGTTDGKIVPARGPNTFGWDPIIEIDGTGKTYVAALAVSLTAARFAEMSAQEKNSVCRAQLRNATDLQLSHRAKALEKLKQYLSTY